MGINEKALAAAVGSTLISDHAHWARAISPFSRLKLLLPHSYLPFAAGLPNPIVCKKTEVSL